MRTPILAILLFIFAGAISVLGLLLALYKTLLIIKGAM